MSERTRREAQEGFGEAGPGEAQSENPPLDPEMIEDEADEAAEVDQDAEPPLTDETVESDSERDQAEG
jgi:hypothetical protein